MANGSVKIPSTTLWRNNKSSPSSANIKANQNINLTPKALEAVLDESSFHSYETEYETTANLDNLETSLSDMENNLNNDILTHMRAEFSNCYDLNDHDDFEQFQLSKLLTDNKITKKELAAAYLVAFFNGTVTQTSLKDFITLSNITSSDIKLPTSFDGLAKVLMGVKSVYDYRKKWFCGVCL